MITTVKCDEDKEVVYVKVNNIYIIIDIDKIKYVDTYKNYVIYHLENETYVKERKTLRKLVEENQNKYFLQINKGCVVNLQYVQKISNRRVWLKSGESFGLSRGREKDIKKRFITYKMAGYH